MIIEDAFEVDAPVDRVWAVLRDVPRVASCIPGTKITEVVDPKTFRGSIGVKVGPVSVNYNATIVVEQLDEAAHEAKFAIDGDEMRGRGGVRASLVSRVEPVPAGARVTLRADAKISGVVATVGGRLIEGVAKKSIAMFAENLKKIL
ncbi:MAG: SRPBCC family protein [Vulcanimicrobiaceae bacterium]